MDSRMRLNVRNLQIRVISNPLNTSMYSKEIWSCIHPCIQIFSYFDLNTSVIQNLWTMGNLSWLYLKFFHSDFNSPISSNNDNLTKINQSIRYFLLRDYISFLKKWRKKNRKKIKEKAIIDQSLKQHNFFNKKISPSIGE